MLSSLAAGCTFLFIYLFADRHESSIDLLIYLSKRKQRTYFPKFKTSPLILEKNGVFVLMMVSDIVKPVSLKKVENIDNLIFINFLFIMFYCECNSKQHRC